MGRTVYAEERHWNYLISLTKSNEYTAGLILGQNAGSRDYVVHLAKTPPPAGKNVVEETLMSSTINTNSTTVSKDIKSIKDMEESWVADHAKHVTRMLPGGMWVRGVFMIGPEDILNDNTNVHKLKSILLSIYKNLLSNTFLCGNNEEEHLILCLNSLTQKYVCKSINIVKDGILKPVDWKFQEKACKWQQLETSVDFNQLFHIAIDKDPETLKEQLQNILKNISETVHSAIVVTEGEVRSPDDLIESIGQKQKNKKHSKDKSSSNEKVLHVSLYIPCIETKEPNLKPTVTPCSAIMRLTGQLFARVFLHQKATIGESSTAIKQDIIRSVASRFEMHWDSLIEEENGSPEEKVTLHEPPRRVLIALPQSKVTFSDYLFPGEGPQEALISLQDLLDLEVQESRVEKDVELQIDPSEFYCQSEMDIISSDHNNIQSNNQQSKMYLIALVSAVVVLIAAVLIHYLS